MQSVTQNVGGLNNGCSPFATVPARPASPPSFPNPAPPRSRLPAPETGSAARPESPNVARVECTVPVPHQRRTCPPRFSRGLTPSYRIHW